MKMQKKLLAWVITILMVVSMVPTTVLAKATKVIVEPTLVYQRVYGFSNGVAPVLTEDRAWILVDQTGSKVAALDYDEADEFRDGLARVKKGGKYGYIDATGQGVIAPIYDILGYFNDGLANAYIDGKYGAIDKTGQEIIPFKYSYIGDFKGGIANMKYDGKFGAIDTVGKEVVPPIYDYVIPYEGGMTIVEKDDKMGVVDKTGKLVIPINYSSIYSGYKGHYIAKKNYNDNYVIIDTTGKEVDLSNYDDVGGFDYNGLAIIEKNRNRGLIDTEGHEVVAPIYDFIMKVDGILIAKKDNKYELLDTTGKIITPFKYDYPSDYVTEGLIGVSLNDKWGVIDCTGKEIISTKYDGIGNFCNGQAWIKVDGKYGLIDKTGQVLIAPVYDSAYYYPNSFNDGLAWIKKDGKYGIVELDENAQPLKVKVKGKLVDFPDAQPFMDENERTLVPVRFVSEALGAKVDWEDATSTVIITKGTDIIRFTIGEKSIKINGKAKSLDTAAIIKDDRTFVPLRFVSEALGESVSWDDATSTAIIGG